MWMSDHKLYSEAVRYLFINKIMGFIKHFRDDFEYPEDDENNYDSGIFSKWKNKEEKIYNEVEKSSKRLSVDDLVKILKSRSKKELNLILNKLNDEK